MSRATSFLLVEAVPVDLGVLVEAGQLPHRPARCGRVDVTEAGDWSRALELVDADPPDLIVLDLGLPDMSGWDILERLRSEPSTAHVPVVVATGESRSAVINRLGELNAVMLEKPYTGAVLRANIRVLLEASEEVGSPT